MPRQTVSTGLFVLGCLVFPLSSRAQHKVPLMLSPLVLSQSSFAKDFRLAKPISLNLQETTGELLVRQLADATGIHLTIQTYCIASQREPVAIACQKQSAFAVLDALAALHLDGWAKQPDGYLLCEDVEGFEHAKVAFVRRYDPLLLPSDEEERRFFIAASQFSAWAKKPIGANMLSAAQTPAGVPVRNMPPVLQECVRQMALSINKIYSSSGKPQPLPISRLLEMSINLQLGPALGFDHEMIGFIIPGQLALGWRYNNYEEWRRNLSRANAITMEGKPIDGYATNIGQITKERARSSKALQQKISIHRTNATFSEVLLDLHIHYGIPFLSESNRTLSERANIDLSDVKLGDALDRLIAIYKLTDWEYRAAGFIIVRGVTTRRSMMQFDTMR